MAGMPKMPKPPKPPKPAPVNIPLPPHSLALPGYRPPGTSKKFHETPKSRPQVGRRATPYPPD